MNEQKYNNPMRENVFDLPELCRKQCKQIEEASRMTISTPEIYGLRRIIITGCGDSYAAGLAMKPAVERLTGLPVEVITAIDFSRYTPADVMTSRKGDTLVLAVSNSGKVTRLAEGMERAAKYGCMTLAVTGNSKSPLAKVSGKIVGLEIPAFVAGNGVRSYLVSMMALVIIAIRIGEVKGRYMMADAAGYREVICGYAGRWSEALPELDRQVLDISMKNKEKDRFDFVGAGGSFGTAWFSQAKIIEAIGEWAVFSDTEGWLHLNCFLKHLDDKFTMLYASAAGPEWSRAREVIDAIAIMDEELYVVTDDKALPIPDKVHKIVVPGAGEQWMWPLLNYIPAALLAGYLCELRGEAYGRGCVDNWEVCGTTELLTNSRKIIL